MGRQPLPAKNYVVDEGWSLGVESRAKSLAGVGAPLKSQIIEFPLVYEIENRLFIQSYRIQQITVMR